MKQLKPVNHYLTQFDNGTCMIDSKQFREDGLDLTIKELRTLGSLLYTDLAGELPFLIDGRVSRVKVHPFVEAVGECIVGFINRKDIIDAMSLAGIIEKPSPTQLEELKLIFKKLGANPDSFIQAVKKNLAEKGSWG